MERIQERKGYFKWFVKTLGKKRVLFGLAILSLSFQNLFFAYCLSQISNIMVNINFSSRSFSWLFIIFLACMFVTIILSYVGEYKLIEIVEEITMAKRKNIYEKILTLPLNYFDSHHKSSLYVRLINDVEIIKSFYEDVLPMLVSLFVGIIGSVIIIFSWNEILAIINLIVGIVSFVAFNGISLLIRNETINLRTKQDEDSALFLDIIKGFKIIKNYKLEQRMFSKYDAIIEDYKRIDNRISMKNAGYETLNSFIMLGIFGIMLFVGIILVKLGMACINDVISSTILSTSVIWMYRSLGQYLNNYSRCLVSVKRIMEIENSQSCEQMKEKYDNIQKPLCFEDMPKGICVKNLTVQLNDSQKILTDINLSITENTCVGIRGESGVGKTTLLRTLMGLYIPQNGYMSCNGKVFNQISLQEWRMHFIYISQDPYLFPESILENIRMKNVDVPVDSVIEAAKIVEAHEFIEKLPHKYETIIKDTQMLSSGEKQRLCLARAFINRKAVLLLDEPTSALDLETEHIFNEHLAQLKKNRIIIVVSHRDSIFKNCDYIINMEGGKLL